MFYKKIIILSLVLMLLMLCPYITMAWTVDGEWESGSSITWDVPYQSQAHFRNWTTSCMATSGAMIINFMYSGAYISEFSGNAHPWSPITITHPYETTGQRVYSFGIISGNNYNGNLSDYLRNYPKNDISQYYCDDATCTKPYFGPLDNESLKSDNAPTTCTSVINQGGTYGDIDALASYLSKKHYIEIVKLQEHSIANIRNFLYKGPVIISVWREIPEKSHVVVVKGINSDGNFIINDPWGEDFDSSPSQEDDGSGKIYVVLQSGKLNAYENEYSIKYAYSVPVYSNFNRLVSPFSPWNIPVEAALTFKYDYDACENENENESYNGDGDYKNIRNGFYCDSASGEWNYFYNKSLVLGFPFTTTVQGSEATTFARWTPYFPRSGKYRVLVGIYPSSSNSSKVQYKVYHRDGQDTATIDQTNDTNNYEIRENIVYKLLGEYNFNEGANENNGSVKVVNTSNVSGDINVDIVRFVYSSCSLWDVQNDFSWCYSYVHCLYDLGLVSCQADGSFGPGNKVSRAEFIKMVVLALEKVLGYELPGVCIYPVPWNMDPSHWYYVYLMKAYLYVNYNVSPSERLAFWNTNESINFFQELTREEAAHIVRNALNLPSYNLFSGIPPFTDVPFYKSYSSWVFKIWEVGILDGYKDNTFKPDEILNRAEAAKMIRNMLNYKGYFNNNCNVCPEICNKD